MASLLPPVPLFFFFFCFCCGGSFLLGGSLGPALAAETPDAFLLLTKIKPALHGAAAAAVENLQLSSWNASVPLCQWRGLEWALSDGSPLACDDDPASRTNLSLFRDPSVQLTALRLPAAGLSGSVPREIGELSSLRSLFLGVNSLAGSLPLELGNCPALADVDLSGNSIAGALPPSIWNLCGRLVSLRLHGNNLSGTPPEPAVPGTSCERLRVVDLGGNRLQGLFPGFLAEFHGLQELDLGGNLFSGPIPETLAALANLERL